MNKKIIYSISSYIIITIICAGFVHADWTKLSGTPSTYWYIGLSADAHGSVFFYESTGGGGDGFWHYDIVSDTWQQLTNTPINGRGAYLEADTSSGLVYWQSGVTRFFVYDPSGSSWSELSPTPVAAWSGAYVMTNSDMCVDPLTGKLYWHNGGRAFYEYDIAGDTWTLKDSTLVSGNGDMVVHPGLNKIYWHQGFDPNSGHQDGFYEYDITGDVWQPLTPTPVTCANGGLTILPSEDRIYWSRGGGSADFLQYDIQSGVWSSLGSTPRSGQFGNLAGDWGDNVIYYYSGFGINPDSIFWKYTSTPGIRDGEKNPAVLPRVQCASVLFKDKITLIFPSVIEHKSPVTLCLYDVSGRLLFDRHYASVPAILIIDNNDITELPAGVYVLIIELESHTESFKVTKIE